jgi:hypothetical protein
MATTVGWHDMGDEVPDGIPVTVETLLFGVRDGGLTYRVARGALTRGQRPDDLAVDLAASPGVTCGGDRDRRGRRSLVVLHSTSWRLTDDHRLVLTYAALPDPDPGAPAVVLTAGDPIVGSADPLRPAPPVIGLHAVAAHAARHLAWLRHTDEVVATALAALPAFWHALDAFPPGPAGALRPTLAGTVAVR